MLPFNSFNIKIHWKIRLRFENDFFPFVFSTLINSLTYFNKMVSQVTPINLIKKITNWNYCKLLYNNISSKKWSIHLFENYFLFLKIKNNNNLKYYLDILHIFVIKIEKMSLDKIQKLLYNYS